MDFEPQYVSLTTDRIEICASQAFTDEDDCCAYYLKIENNSDAPIMVLGKDLNITDTQGHHFVTSDHTFKGEILELNPGEYFEFEDMMPTLPGTAVLYGTCRIIKENRAQDIKIPALELVSSQNSAVVFN
ncbi:MAG: ApaG domain [Alphaproteobacteria bacterium]|nr:ApaG domain [Alphaproteobacteria bacterium]